MIPVTSVFAWGSPTSLRRYHVSLHAFRSFLLEVETSKLKSLSMGVTIFFGHIITYSGILKSFPRISQSSIGDKDPSRIILKLLDRSMTVEGAVVVDFPPSIMRSTFSPNVSTASWAVVQGCMPVGFALVPINGPWQRRNNSKVILLLGTLTARLSPPAVTSGGKVDAHFRTIVSCPGQNRLVSISAGSFHIRMFMASFFVATRIGRGFLLPSLIFSILLRAIWLNGSQPRPYTVSVG